MFYFFILNTSFAFLYVTLATSSKVIFLTSAIFFAIYFTFLGSVRLPLKGSGDKYGLSVSIKTLSEYMILKLDWNAKLQTLKIERKNLK